MQHMRNIEYWAIEKVVPYDNNPRNNDGGVKSVAESIRTFGWQQPIVVDKQGVIIAGHTRYKAAKQLKCAEVPVVVADGLTEEQVTAYRLADNKTGELSSWDDQKLQKELEKLYGVFDMTLFGFSGNQREVQEDNFEVELPEEPKTQLGDMYRMGRHILLCGDSTSPQDVERLMSGAKADMLLTDPPYNVDYKGSAGKIKNDSMSDEEFRAFLTSALFCAKTVMKPGAAFHIWHADAGMTGYSFRGACIDAGLGIRQTIIWEKNVATLGRQDFQWQHEPCLTGENPLGFPDTEEYQNDNLDVCLYGWVDGKHYWFRDRKQKTILHFDKPITSKEHPTTKPVKLFDYEICCNTRENEIVLDLFGGSGTTIVACEQDGRCARVMELDPKYCDVIVQRWEELTGEKAELVKLDV